MRNQSNFNKIDVNYIMDIIKDSEDHNDIELLRAQLGCALLNKNTSVDKPTQHEARVALQRELQNRFYVYYRNSLEVTMDNDTSSIKIDDSNPDNSFKINVKILESDVDKIRGDTPYDEWMRGIRSAVRDDLDGMFGYEFTNLRIFMLDTLSERNKFVIYVVMLSTEYGKSPLADKVKQANRLWDEDDILGETAEYKNDLNKIKDALVK